MCFHPQNDVGAVVADQRKKTLSYHRAQYFCPHPSSINLGLCVKQATDKLKTVADRTAIKSGGQFIRIAHIKSAMNGEIYLHLTVDTPGEPASIVPKASDLDVEIKVSTVNPPNDAEFMDGDAFIFVIGNDICICATGVRVAAIRVFLFNLFEKAGIRKDATQFQIHDALDTGKLALIRKRGVKEIELKGTLYRASMDYQKRKTQPVGAIEKLSKHFKAIFGSEHDVTDDSLSVAVVLKVDGRRTRGITIGHKRLERIAESIIENEEDDDEYLIVTTDGEQIKPHEIRLRTTVTLDSMGKSVDREHAWDALASYYDSLSSGGLLSQ